MLLLFLEQSVTIDIIDSATIMLCTCFQENLLNSVYKAASSMDIQLIEVSES